MKQQSELVMTYSKVMKVFCFIAVREDRLFGLGERNAAVAVSSQMPSSSKSEFQAPTSYIPAINP